MATGGAAVIGRRPIDQQVSGLGLGGQPSPSAQPTDPTKSSFGLNLKSNAPFDPFAGPSTVGAFNREVLAGAQPQYMPQLQQIGGEISAENLAGRQRTQDLGDIYKQYQGQAQQAFRDTQGAISDIINANAGGDTASQANLAAALRSALGGGDKLAAMMGLSPGGADRILPYTTAAGAAGTAGANELKGIAAGLMQNAGSQEANAALERSSQMNTESLRHQAALQGLRQQRGALVEQIPGIIEKVREQLISDLENANALKFQQALATKQFNLAAQAQSFNQNLQTQQFALQKQSTNAQIAQNWANINNQTKQLAQAAQQAQGQAQGQQQNGAISYLTSFLAPTQAEVTPAHKDPNTGQEVPQSINYASWHRDVGQALQNLMDLYGYSLDDALKLMVDIGGSTPIGGKGSQSVAQWARTYKSRAAQQLYNSSPQLSPTFP